MKTLAEKIEVMKAALEGKKIQVRPNNRSNWSDVGGQLHWDWLYFDYRVKPEPPKPREWVLIKNTKCECGSAIDGLGGWHAYDVSCRTFEYPHIRVREVLE